MTKLTTESNIADIAARFNELNGSATDVKTLAKRGKAKLLAQIEALEAKQPAPQAEPAVAHEAAAPAQPAVVSSMVSALVADKAEAAVKAEPTKKEKKEKGPVIRVEAEKLLLEVVDHDEDKRPYGHTYEYVLNKLREMFPGAKTTVACLRWYAVHMRERGERVPNRRRAAPNTAAK